ncbi:glycosyltransferase family 4 protein [Micromonospora sp. CPCC 205561]|uniref:glycosyltransferase family 4 protein n=1 Tax=Micromonospora sp. CPCC 205561 TaxID=3122407 RepID=UPI002FF39A78
MADAVDVELFVLTNRYDRDFAHAQLTLPHCANLWLFESVPTPPERPPDDVPERVWGYRSAAFDERLRQHLRDTEVDLIHVEGYFLAGHLPPDRRVPLLVVEENIEYLLDREHEAAGQRRGASWQASRALEHEVWSVATLVACVSAQDAAVVLRDAPDVEVALMPNGFDHLTGAEFKTHTGVGSRVVFVGNYSWAPTRHGASELITRIWPKISQVVPNARLALVGADLPPDLAAAAAAAERIDIVGEVDSVLPALADADVFVCPIQTGSGVKVKVIEAMHAGCPIVCTDPAIRGLPDGVDSAVVLADGHQEIADAVVRLLHDPARRNQLSRRAVDLIRGLPTWDEAAKMLLDGWQRAAFARGEGQR